ncbi:beta-glucosidase, partial [Bacteroides ovatus]
MNDKYKRIIEMSALPLMLLFLSAVALTFQSCKGKSKSNNLSAATDSLSDDALMDTVQ